MKQMINRGFYPKKSMIIANRGYEKHELFTCCNEKNQKFVIRVKDKDSNGILSAIDLPDGDLILLSLANPQEDRQKKPKRIKIMFCSLTNLIFLILESMMNIMNFHFE